MVPLLLGAESRTPTADTTKYCPASSSPSFPHLTDVSVCVRKLCQSARAEGFLVISEG